MAKRFTCTDKWKKRHLRGLEAPYKLLWFYLLDDCNHAGVWDVDIDVAAMRIGCDVNEAKALEVFGDKIHVFDDGYKWFVKDFVDFQYGELNESNRAHKSVIDILKNKGLLSLLEGCKDKDKVKDKVKGKRRSKKQIVNDLPETLKPFWDRLQPMSTRNNPTQCAERWLELEKDFDPADIFGFYADYASTQSDPKFVAAFSVKDKVNPLNIRMWKSGNASSQPIRPPTPEQKATREAEKAEQRRIAAEAMQKSIERKKSESTTEVF